MQTSVTRSVRKLALPACALAAMAAPSAASALPVTTDLHVEAAGRALVPGQAYLTDTTSVTTDTRQPACGGTGQRKALTGPNALGALVDASTSASTLSPLGVSDKFSFGLLLCGVGSYTASDSAFWLYKVNRVAPEVGGEQLALKEGDDVLWYLSDTGAGRNTGDELAIEAPARAQTGAPIKVSVFAYAFNGARTPAAGAKLLFPGGQTTADAAGQATVTIASAGYAALRAGRGPDIPSRIEKVCVADELTACAAVRGKRLFGTPRADVLSGTAGRDVLEAGAGDDRVDIRGGERDFVRCGLGRDTVRMSPGDRAKLDCEVVLLAGKRVRG